MLADGQRTDAKAVLGVPRAARQSRSSVRRVCFVPHTGIQVDLFARVLDALQRDGRGPVAAEVLTLGRLVRERAEPALKQRGWAYRDLAEFGTRDCRAILRQVMPDVIVMSMENEATVTLARAARALGVPVIVLQDAFFSLQWYVVHAYTATKHTGFVAKPYTWRERWENKRIQWLRDSYHIETMRTADGRSRVREYLSAGWAHCVPGQAARRLVKHGWPPPFGTGADRLAVMCDFLKDELVSSGFPAERIMVTGQPRFDPLVAWRGEAARRSAQERLRALGVPLEADRPTVMVATEAFMEYHVWSRQQHADYLGTLVRAVESLPRPVNLVFKLHPQENLEEHRRLLEAKWSRHMVRDVESFVALAASDVVITSASTIVVEALLLKRLVAIANWMPKHLVNPYVTHGIGTPVNEASNLTSILNRCLVVPEQMATPASRAAYFTGPDDGRSAERAAGLIQELIGGKHAIGRPGADCAPGMAGGQGDGPQ